MRILVLSDLHIGEKARGKDLCPITTDKWLDENYEKDFMDFLKAESVAVDYIVIAGDISNSASFDEFSLASTFISNIAVALSIPSDKILIIPGNHDVDWRVFDVEKGQSAEALAFRKGQRYDPLKNALKHSIETATSPYFTTWEFDDLFVIGYNSAWHDGKDALIHNGTITDDIIVHMGEQISSKDLKNKIKLFITHHHPFQYSDPIPNPPDFSIMNNAANLLEMLSANKFDMIIHGHKHIPKINTLDMGSIHPIAMLCAGSFSVILDQRYNGCVLNMFHIVNFEGRDENTERVFGYVENYSFCSHHKWLKSQKNNSNVLHKHGFGSYNSIPILKKELTPLIQSQIAIKGAILWSDLCKDNRKLSYHTPEFIDLLTTEIGNDLKLQKHATDTEIIFISDGK